MPALTFWTAHSCVHRCWKACLLYTSVLVERSSYESDPLARMEWIKLYGILLGREEQAEQVFSAQETAVQPILSQEPTGKSCAFFSLTTNNLATVRKGSDLSLIHISTKQEKSEPVSDWRRVRIFRFLRV